MAGKAQLLYVYEERIPAALRALVEGSLPLDEFDLLRMSEVTPDDERRGLLARADVVLFAPGRHLPDDVLAAATRARLMQLWSSGYDKFNTAGAARAGIPVANNGGANAISVAEHAVLLMLAVNKWLPDSHRRTVEGRWAGNSHGLDMFLLNGKTVGIYGFGNIGRHVARLCHGFGMRVLYYDPRRAPDEVEGQTGAELVDAETLLRQADVLTLHLHLAAGTRHLIGAAALETMKAGAVLINVSRAELVDEQALLDSLRSGRLRGAGLDVHYQEPTRAFDPLLALPNVVATPHMAGSTRDAYATALANCVANLRRVLRGERPLWVVNGVPEWRGAASRADRRAPVGGEL